MQNRQPIYEPTKLKTLMKSCASEVSRMACLNLTTADAQDFLLNVFYFKRTLLYFPNPDSSTMFQDAFNPDPSTTFEIFISRREHRGRRDLPEF